MPACRSCGDPIQWARTLHDRANPLNLEPCKPTDRGAMVVWRDAGGKMRCAGVDAAADAISTLRDVSYESARAMIDAGDYPAHLSHFATCENANEHRGTGIR